MSPASTADSEAVSVRRLILTRIVLACLCLAIATVSPWISRPGVAVAGSPTRSRLAVLVLAPYLTFDDLSPVATPALWSLAEDGAVGAVNARTADRQKPNAASGALTISASRWAGTDAASLADAADIDELQSFQADSLTRPVLGSLGSAIRAVGGHTGSIGIARSLTDALRASNAAELAAMDTDGRVDVTNATTTSNALRVLGSSGAPGLLVVDVPALAAASESSATGADERAAHIDAVRELDASIAELRGAVGNTGTVLVVSSATNKSPYRDPDLGLAIVAGPGFRGLLTSPSTHRTRLVTTLDVAPTILAALGINPPSTMVGSAMTSHATSTPLAEELAALASDQVSTGIIDWLREAWFIRGFVAFALIAVAFALWTLERRPHDARVRSISTSLVLISAALPPATWLMFVASVHPPSLVAAIAALAAAAATIMAALLGVRWYVSTRDSNRNVLPGTVAAAISVSTLTAVVILADQWMGDPLRTGLFSYSVRSGWRFYGMGNEGAALVVGASLVAVGLAVDALRDTRWHTIARRFGVPVVGSIVLITTAAPFAGANAGAAIWGVVAYAVAWVALNRIRMRAKAVALTAALIVAVVAALIAIDLTAASGGGTHLARFAAGILAGDLRSTAELVSRKLANNLGYFVATPYTLLFLGLGGVFALLRRGSSSSLRTALEPKPALRGALLGACVGGLVALATEDSSSVMPALLWFAALMPALWIALATPRPATSPILAKETPVSIPSE